MYRCQSCRKRTEDIDVPPCNPANHKFIPEKIRLMHKYVYSKEGVYCLCTGSRPTGNMTGLGGNLGITCIRCKEAMKAGMEATRNYMAQGEASTPKELFSSREDGVQGADSTQINVPDTLPDDEVSSDTLPNANG